MNCSKEKLQLFYHKGMKDFIFSYPRKCDGNLIVNHLIQDVLKFKVRKNEDDFYNFDTFNLKEELEKRGYDITTLKFSIELKKD
jgi:hypothetical protein